MKDKAQRLARKPSKVKTQIDMGSMDAAQQGATAKTQKAYRTARKDGGKVHGKAAPKRADKVQRVKKADAGSVSGSRITNEPVGAALGRWWRSRNEAPEISAGGSGAVPGAYGMAQPLTDMRTYDQPSAPVSTTEGERRQFREGTNDRIAASAMRPAMTPEAFTPSRPEPRSAAPAPAPTPVARSRAAAPATRKPTADELMDYYNIGGGRVSNEMAQLAAMRNRPEDAGPMKRGGAAKKKSAKKTAKGR
jgi:hypothetical protein